MHYPDLPLDAAMFDETRRLAGAQFPMLLRFFLEDTKLYLGQLPEALANARIEDTARLAHTVKSSAGQFGLSFLADQARMLETAARTNQNALAPLVEALTHAFAGVRPALESYLASELH